MRAHKILLSVAGFGLAGTITTAAALIGMAEHYHWSFNRTTCMPVGFYRRGPAPKTLKVGDRVFFCPPVGDKAMKQAMSGLWLEYAPHGKWACADHLMPFMKEVVALPGQKVTVTKQGVTADGKRLHNSRVVTSIENGKLKVIHLPYGTYTVPRGMFWDYAPGNFAYTSAYYGPVPLKNILGAMRPVPWLTIPGSQYWLKVSKG
ncbi:S26 family signal peptidase [Acidithiobacillus ferriphilus]|uniref:S26 family signal peptidase n=1 Tax=Acidithiobacillus ferriphilus TaxID=1689834 RepID=UPI001C072546|nr:S26 family signal peptidase [Acidithiobacillus ferriphilus]MBU2831881.1 conjugal transfer protein [Acidithiobacillus ferriphilus]